jgi:hypothetical protein
MMRDYMRNYGSKYSSWGGVTFAGAAGKEQIQVLSGFTTREKVLEVAALVKVGLKPVAASNM